MKPLIFTLLCWFGASFLAQPPASSLLAAEVAEPGGGGSPGAPVPWSTAGDWDCTHPAWTGRLTLSPDGSFHRGEDGDAGRWTLSGSQGQLVLALLWNDWSAETAAMIGPDEFRGKVRTGINNGELRLRRVRPTGAARAEAPAKPAPARPVSVLAASYSFGSQYVDVTGRVRDLLREDKPFQANPQCLLCDPQPGWNKALVIFCEVRGKLSIFSVGEGEEVSDALLLQNARPVAAEKPAAGPAVGSYPVEIRLSGSQTPADIQRAGVFFNPGDCTLVQTGENLLLTLPGGALHDQFGGLHNAPTALTPVDGDFMVQAKVSGNFDPGLEPAGDFPRAFHGAGLLVFEDDSNYVRFERAEMIWKDRPGKHIYWHPLVQQNLGGEYDEFMGPRNSLAPVFTEPATDLRLVRKGSVMYAFISPDDGAHWNQVARFETIKAKRVLVGVSASNTSAQAFKPVFVGLTVTPLAGDGGGGAINSGGRFFCARLRRGEQVPHGAFLPVAE